MPKALRSLVAGIAASATFVGLYLGLSFVLWVALGLAGAVYLGAWLALPARVPLSERRLEGGLTEADRADAIQVLRRGSQRLRALRPGLDPTDVMTVERMADTIDAIRQHHEGDPRDFLHTRQFVRHDLGKMVDAVEKYAELYAKVRGEAAEERLAPLGAQIAGFVPVLEKVEEACLKNDFFELEVQVDVLRERLEVR